ncbi:MAG: MBL fold metallo-hydrolase [Candidatus Omnitrophota bacterium]
MQIKILGTRGEIDESKPYHSRHSGVLIDKKLLFDLGEREYLRLNPMEIFITHLHPDHAFFVRKNEDPGRFYYYPGNFHDEKQFGEYTIRPVPTRHSLRVDSQAYLVQKGSRRVFYTGDLVWIDKKYHHLLKDLDLVITEASFMRKGGMIRKDKSTGRIYGHQGIPDLVRLLGKFSRRIIFMHFGSWFYKDIRAARKKLRSLSVDMELIVAYDGFEYEM